jgi:hypothetical protein
MLLDVYKIFPFGFYCVEGSLIAGGIIHLYTTGNLVVRLELFDHLYGSCPFALIICCVKKIKKRRERHKAGAVCTKYYMIIRSRLYI